MDEIQARIEVLEVLRQAASVIRRGRRLELIEVAAQEERRLAREIALLREPVEARAS